MTQSQIEARAALIELAAPLWRQGLSAKEIGDRLGVSEARILTYASQNRETFPSRRRQRGEKNAGEIRHAAAKSLTKNTIKPEFPEKAPGFDGVTMRRRRYDGCEFPLWGHHETFDFETSLYCGAPKRAGYSYCGFHCDKVTGDGTRSERAAVAVLKRATRAGK